MSEPGAWLLAIGHGPEEEKGAVVRDYQFWLAASSQSPVASFAAGERQ